MKVLVVHTSYKYKGGEDTVVAAEIALLKANGISVELLEFNNDGNTLLKLLQLPFNLNAWLKTRRKLKSYKADLVHIHNLHFAASPSVIYAVRSKRTPLVYTLHNYRLLCPSATLFHNGQLFLHSTIQRFPWKAISAGVYKNSRILTFWLSASMQMHKWIGTWQIPDRIIALTPHSKKILLASSLKLREQQLIVKPNFSTAPRLMQESTSDYFCYIGRLSEEKGIMLLLGAFSKCGCKIKIAGDGPLKDTVVDYSRRFSNIEFMGAVAKEDVFKVINQSSALIFPSIWYEGMPLTIIEAFACSIPVIASSIGAMEHMITHGYNGLHSEAGNERDLLKALSEWQSFNSDKKESYRNNAWATYTRHYSPQNNFRELMSIYKSVVNKEHSAAKPRVKPVHV